MDSKSKIILHTGRKMPVMGLGTWQLTRDTPGSIQKALELGYPMIDTSGDYGTQSGIGEAIKKNGVDRDSFYLVTKVEEDEDAYDATSENLGEMGLPYADLTLIHRPPPTGAGAELWQDLIRAKMDGLTKDIGVSNYDEEQIEELIEATGEVPVVNQIEWSPFGHSADMMEFCDQNDIIIQAYSPLTRGKKLNDKVLKEIAEPYGKSVAQLLIRWNLQLGTVPLPKASQIEHMAENIDVFDFEINLEDMERLNKLNEAYSSLSGLAYV